MSTSHAHVNAEIILALSKMGVYMERDRAKLAAMSPSTQNTRLRKAFDRAVENCCIFPLLFDKEQREMGKLSFEGLPDWTGWRTSHKELMSRQSRTMDNFVKALGTILHFIDRPMSLSILLQKQTGLSGGMMVLGPNGKLAGDVDNSAIFNAVVKIIKRSEKDKAEAAYFWAARKGDCIEIDVVDLPDQSLGW
ncbi:hypothetical protein FB451DRAFT_1140655 [Mycena latifolia]|nr:hypothetical protein FB451DRAFT_1140655 [Mycena latifolia]